MPSEFKAFVPTRAMMDVSYVLSLPATERLICIDERVLDMVRFLIFEYGSRQVNFYRSISAAGYFTPTDEERDQLDDLIGAFLFSTSEGFMGCMEDLVDAINNLTISVTGGITNAGGCGCAGTGGAGLFETNGSTFEDAGDNFPDGYSDRAEYLASKCALATYIVAGWIGDLARLRTIDAAGKSAAALVPILGLTFLVPIPFANLIGIAGVVLALAALSISVFVDAIDELISWLQGLDICTLYAAVSASGAKAALQDDLDSQTFTQDSLTKALFSYFLNFDALNILFDPKGTTLNIDELPASDCSECQFPCDSGFSQEIGTGPSIAEGYRSEPFISAPNGGLEYIQVTSFKVGLPITFVSLSGWVTSGDPHDFRIASGGDGTAGDLYNSGTPPSFPVTFDPGPTGNIAFVFSGAGSNQFELVLDCGL